MQIKLLINLLNDPSCLLKLDRLLLISLTTLQND